MTLNFVHDPARALQEMVHVTRPAGIVAAYPWDYAQPDFFLTRFWSAVSAATGARAAGDERGRWRLCSLDRTGRTIPTGQHGTWTIHIETTFLSADELWEGFLLGVGPSGAYATDLRPERAAEVRACLYARLPVTSDRSVHLTATALAMAGTSP